MITCTYDASDSSPADAFKIYWNGTLINSSVITNNQGLNSGADMDQLMLCSGISAPSGTGNSNCDMDEWAYYDSELTSGNVTTLYNSGTIKSADLLLTSNLVESVRFDINNDITETTSVFGGTITGGTTPAY